MNFLKVICFTLFLTPSFSSVITAQPINHEGVLTFSDNISEFERLLYEGTYILQAPDVTYRIGYRLSSIFGEPTVFCQSTIIIDPGSFAGSNDRRDLYDKLRVSDINFFGVIKGNSNYVIDCDVGSPAKPFIGSLQDFRQLTREQKKSYLSFNVAGSPNWDKIIHNVQGFASNGAPTGVLSGWNDLNLPEEYVNSSRAKDLYTNQNFEFQEWNVYGRGSFIEVSWDLSGLEKYLAEREKSGVEENIRENESKINELEEAINERVKTEYGDSFWDQPDNPILDNEENEINTLKRSLDGYQDQITSINQDIEEAERERQEIDNYLAQKRRQIENKPTAEELRNELIPFENNNGLWGYKSELGKIIINPTYGRAYQYNEHGLAKVYLGTPKIRSSTPAANFCTENNKQKDCWGIIDKNNKLILTYNNRYSVAVISSTKIFLLGETTLSIVSRDEAPGMIVNSKGDMIYNDWGLLAPAGENLLYYFESFDEERSRYNQLIKRDDVFSLTQNSGSRDCLYLADFNDDGSKLKYDYYDGQILFLKSRIAHDDGSLKEWRVNPIGIINEDGEKITEPKFHGFLTCFSNGKAKVVDTRRLSTEMSENNIRPYRTWWINTEGNRISDYQYCNSNNSCFKELEKDFENGILDHLKPSNN